MPLKIESSKDTFMRNMSILLLGPPGVGKSFLAGTYSEHWPKELPSPKPVELKDMLWIMADPGGLDGFAEQGITVPTIDVSTVPMKDYKSVLGELSVLVEKHAKENPQLRAIVVDTASVLCSDLVTALTPVYDNWGLWNAVLAQQVNMVRRLRGIPGVAFIALFHQKVAAAADDTAKAKLEAAGIELGGATLAVKGDIINTYRGQSSLILPVRKMRKMNTFERVVLPGAHGADAKTRFACLAQREPADLGAIFAKVRASSRV